MEELGAFEPHQEDFNLPEFNMPMDESLTTAEPVPESLDLREDSEVRAATGEPPEKRRRTDSLLPEDIAEQEELLPVDEAEIPDDTQDQPNEMGFSKSTVTTIKTLQSRFGEDVESLSF